MIGIGIIMMIIMIVFSVAACIAAAWANIDDIGNAEIEGLDAIEEEDSET